MSPCSTICVPARDLADRRAPDERRALLGRELGERADPRPPAGRSRRGSRPRAGTVASAGAGAGGLERAAAARQVAMPEAGHDQGEQAATRSGGIDATMISSRMSMMSARPAAAMPSRKMTSRKTKKAREDAAAHLARRVALEQRRRAIDEGELKKPEIITSRIATGIWSPCRRGSPTRPSPNMADDDPGRLGQPVGRTWP